MGVVSFGFVKSSLAANQRARDLFEVNVPAVDDICREVRFVAGGTEYSVEDSSVVLTRPSHFEIGKGKSPQFAAAIMQLLQLLLLIGFCDDDEVLGFRNRIEPGQISNALRPIHNHDS